MTKAKVKKVEEGKRIVEKVAASHLVASQEEERLIQATELLTAVRVTQSLGRNLSAQSFRALEHFAETKGFEAFGFTRFDDFLEHSPRSPMTRRQYYERKNALEREGDEAFNTLNALRVPLSARRLLSDGSIQVKGDTLIIGEEQVAVGDRARVVELIRTLADKNAEQAHTIERGKKDVEKYKKKLDAAVKTSTAALLDSSPHDQSLNIALIALGGLKSEADKLSLEEAVRVRDNAVRMISTLFADIREAYRFEDGSGHDFARDEIGDDEVEQMFC